MPTTVLRTNAELLVAAALCFALASCGTNTPPIICNALSVAASCTCGFSTKACPISPGPEFLYATSIGGQILAFSIDHNSGTLSTIGSVPGPSLSLGLTAVNNQFLFASDFRNAQLDGFSINQTTGALTALAGSPFSSGTVSLPGDLASPAGSSLLYAADIGGVDAFTISAAGAPAALSGSPALAGVSSSIAVDPSGKFLYASVPNGIFAYTIDSTGVLAAVPDSPFAIPSGGLPLSIVGTGSYVYAALSSSNQIAAFSVVSGTGALTPVPGSPFSSGTNPSTLVLASGFLYALNKPLGLTNGSITSYSVNSNTGALTPLSGSPFAIGGISMAADSFGQYLYVTGPAGIQALRIDSTNGTLIPVAVPPFPGSGANLLSVVQIPPP
jgi:6-phosphogluconolactonase